jgi:soluble lytic murein transglycosylase-like protein
MYYFIELYADSFNIPKKYAYGIAHAETGYDGPFDWRYDHKQTSSVGAVGPMQVMLATARGLNKDNVSVNKLKNSIEYNVRTSMKLLRVLYNRHGDWKLAFGAYNTGKPLVNNYAIRVSEYNPNWIN